MLNKYSKKAKAVWRTQPEKNHLLSVKVARKVEVYWLVYKTQICTKQSCFFLGLRKIIWYTLHPLHWKPLLLLAFVHLYVFYMFTHYLRFYLNFRFCLLCLFRQYLTILMCILCLLCFFCSFCLFIPLAKRSPPQSLHKMVILFTNTSILSHTDFIFDTRKYSEFYDCVNL